MILQNCTNRSNITNRMRHSKFIGLGRGGRLPFTLAQTMSLVGDWTDMSSAVVPRWWWRRPRQSMRHDNSVHSTVDHLVDSSFLDSVVSVAAAARVDCGDSLCHQLAFHRLNSLRDSLLSILQSQYC